MTKERQIYYRRKDKSIVIEGKQDGKSVLIWTLPNDPTSLLEFLTKASYFEREKADKMIEKVSRLDFRPEKASKDSTDVRLVNINRNAEKDALEQKQTEEIKHTITEEESKALWDLSK